MSHEGLIGDSDNDSQHSLLSKSKHVNTRFSKIFQVKAANNYEEKATGPRTVQLWIMDVLFNNKVCCLVYMRDLSQLLRAQSNEETQNWLVRTSQNVALERKKFLR